MEREATLSVCGKRAWQLGVKRWLQGDAQPFRKVRAAFKAVHNEYGPNFNCETVTLLCSRKAAQSKGIA